MPTAVKRAPVDTKILQRRVTEAVDYLATLLDRSFAHNGIRINLNSVRSDKLALAEYRIYKNKENVGFFKAFAFTPIVKTDDEGKMNTIGFELVLMILIKTATDQKVIELKIDELNTLEDSEEFVNRIFYQQLLPKLAKARIIE